MKSAFNLLLFRGMITSTNFIGRSFLFYGNWNLGRGTWDVVQSIQITFPSPPSFGIVNFPNGNFDNFDLRPPGI
jgi:hypothetical protein